MSEQQSLPANRNALIQRLITHYTVDDIFVGRDVELAQLDAFLADKRPYGLLAAPTGLGKTALLVHWAARVQQHTDWRICFAPINLHFGTAGEQAALEILAHSLADLHNDTQQFQRYDHSPFSLRALISDYLHRPLPPDVRLVLIVDGIDEAIGWEIGQLCLVPPDSAVKIIVAARQRDDMGHVEWMAHLGWEAGLVTCFHLTGLDRAALIALLQAQGGQLAALAADPNFVAQFERVSEGNPLTCNLLIKALPGKIPTLADLSQRPPGLSVFLRDWMETLRRQRQQSQEVLELLALCAIAYGPLASDDLQALAPEIFNQQSSMVDAVQSDEVARFIITVGEQTCIFSHQRLREVFLEEIYQTEERDRLHRRLVAYGNDWWSKRTQPLSNYLRQFWLLHCAELGEWDLIREVVSAILPTADGRGSAQPWQIARYVAEGSNSGYLGDLEGVWRRAETQGDLGLMLRCALIAASLRSQRENLSPELLVSLVQVGTPAGRWSVAAALKHIALMPDGERQADSLAVLAAAGITLPWAQALEIARAIGDEGARARALAALAQRLEGAQQAAVYNEVLAAARAIGDAEKRAAALAALAQRLEGTQQAAVYNEALAAARAIKNERTRADALAKLIPHLPPSLLSNVLATARDIGREWQRAQVLAALAPHLSRELLDEALTMVQAIRSEGARTEALAALIPHLPQELLSETLAVVRAIGYVEERVKALVALAPHLNQDLLGETLAVARAIGDAEERAKVLVALAPHLNHDLLGEVLAVARAIEREWQRARTLGALAPHLPLDQQAAVYGESLTAARTIGDELQRARTLAELAPHLPAELLGEALATAQDIKDERRRAEALAALPPYLPPELLGRALAATQDIRNEQRRAEALAALVPHLPSELLSEALTAILNITDEQRQAEALAALPPRLPPELLSEALAAARDIEDAEARVKALAALSPHLAACPALNDQFPPTLRVLAQRGRPTLLRDLVALMPWLAALAERCQPALWAALFAAIIETAQCWP